MGLDMYAYTTETNLESDVDFNLTNVEDTDEIHYWRKHPNLHGWMQELYDSKGGKSPDFNGVCVVLTLQDLDLLEADIKEGRLPDTSGFFFGQSSGDEDEVHGDLEFIEKAREAIDNGLTVYYTSWW